ncbi:protein-L-isoaspartate(D-aspartate) O-methyltransferase [Marivibrio halodurans]|uniref:Protein-L-isoaspartate O-methyltransferase n=1 Tax=Marivibrio halodurans TaxID=2039722 RepID=A0A8J7S1E7_9PROT|nr:protein-L-isoaspartate(D-aspartate) O-methyltransferase [Marivibrio halodurans]MBP5856919.1 protein-L-isoaspartate(D-aspartate) O-methyltransferase [Marivibrio halodurans]
MAASAAQSDGYRQQKAQLILELRRGGAVTDDAVLEAMEKTPREIFVPETFRRHAYENLALPIALGQTISQPQVVGMMTQALALDRRCKVLEIGTGSGYQAVILSYLCRRVYTVERWKPLMREAEAIFRDLDRPNIHTRFGDGGEGWPEQAPFDRIMLTAAAESVPSALFDQLADGGILIAPIGRPLDDDPLGAQVLCRYVKHAADDITSEDMGGVRFVPLRAGTES